MEPLLDETTIETAVRLCEELPNRRDVGPLVKSLIV